MKVILGTLLILAFVLTDNIQYYGYAYNAKVQKLSNIYTNEILKIGDFLPKTHADIVKDYPKKPWASSISLTKINFTKVGGSSPSWTLTVDKDNKCFNASSSSPGLILNYYLHYVFRYFDTDRIFGNAYLNYSLTYLEIYRCYASPDLKVVLKGSSKVFSGDVLSQPIGKDQKIYPLITQTFDNNMTSDLGQIIKTHLAMLIYNSELSFLNYKTFPVYDDTFNFSNSRPVVNYFSSSKSTDYFSFTVSSSLFSGRAPTPIPITDPAIVNYEVNYDDVNLICTNINNGMAAMNLYFDEFKPTLVVNNSAITCGQISQNYFAIIPELASYLSGEEVVSIKCRKNDKFSFYYTETGFNYTVNLPIYCSFTLPLQSNPFL